MKAGVQAISEAGLFLSEEGTEQSLQQVRVWVPETSGLLLKQPILDWKAQDVYNESLDFKMEVNVFSQSRVMTPVTLREPNNYELDRT